MQPTHCLHTPARPRTVKKTFFSGRLDHPRQPCTRYDTIHRDMAVSTRPGGTPSPGGEGCAAPTSNFINFFGARAGAVAFVNAAGREDPPSRLLPIESAPVRARLRMEGSKPKDSGG